MACFQGLVCKLVKFKMKQHNAEKRAILRYRCFWLCKTETSNDHDMLYISLKDLKTSTWRTYCYTILGKGEEVIKP